MQLKMTMRYCFVPMGLAKSKTFENSGVGKGQLSYATDRKGVFWKIIWQYLEKFHALLPCQLSIQLLGFYPDNTLKKKKRKKKTA